MLRRLLAVAAVCASVFVASRVVAQSMRYDTTTPVTVTCAAGGTNFVLVTGASYKVRAAVETVTYRIGTDGDGGTCASGGTPLDVSAVDFVQARLLGTQTTTANIDGCCKSTGGTGTLVFTRGQVVTQ